MFDEIIATPFYNAIRDLYSLSKSRGRGNSEITCILLFDRIIYKIRTQDLLVTRSWLVFFLFYFIKNIRNKMNSKSNYWFIIINSLTISNKLVRNIYRCYPFKKMYFITFLFFSGLIMMELDLLMHFLYPLPLFLLLFRLL